MSNIILQAAMRQAQNVERAKEQKQAFNTFDSTVNEKYDFTGWDAPDDGLLSNLAKGFAATGIHVIGGAPNLGAKFYSPNSTWGIKNSLNSEQENILNKLSNQRNITESLKQLDNQINSGTLNSDQLERANALKTSTLEELTKYQLTEEEQAIATQPVTTGATSNYLNPLNMIEGSENLPLPNLTVLTPFGFVGKTQKNTHENYDALLDALNLNKESIQKNTERFEKYADKINSNTDQYYNIGNRNLDYAAKGDKIGILDAIEVNATNLTPQQIAYGIGSTSVFAVPVAGQAALGVDAVNTFSRGEDAKLADTNDAILSDAEMAKSGAAALGYYALNKLGIDTIKGNSILSRAIENPVGKVASSGITEGVIEGLQEVAEGIAKGKGLSQIDPDAIGQSVVEGAASGSGLSTIFEGLSNAKPLAEKAGEAASKLPKPKQINPKTEEQLEESTENYTTYRTSEGEVNPKYDPAEAIRTAHRYYEKSSTKDANEKNKLDETINNIISDIKVKRDNTKKMVDMIDSGFVDKLQAQVKANPNDTELKEILDAQMEIFEGKSADELRTELVDFEKHLEKAEITKANLLKETPVEKKENPTADDILDSPIHYSAAEITKVIEQTTDITVQTKLRKLLDYKVEQNKLKNAKGVSSEIFEGSENYIGLREYQNILDEAVQTKNSDTAETYQYKLDNFLASHTSKLKAANKAIKSRDDTVIVRDNNSNNWDAITVKDFNEQHGINSDTITSDTKKLLRETGSLHIHKGSGSLINNIRKEVTAIQQTKNLYEKTLGDFDSFNTSNTSIKPQVVDTPANTTVSNTKQTKNKVTFKDLSGYKSNKKTATTITPKNRFEEEVTYSFDIAETNSMIAFGFSDLVKSKTNSLETNLRRANNNTANKVLNGKKYTSDDVVGYFVANVTSKNRNNFIGFNSNNFEDTSNLTGVAKQRIEELKAAVAAGADIVMHNNSSKYKTDNQVAAEKYLLSKGYQLLKPEAKELVFTKDVPSGVEVVAEKDIQKTLNHYNNTTNNNNNNNSNSKSENINTTTIPTKTKNNKKSNSKLTLEDFLWNAPNHPELALEAFRKAYPKLKEEIKTNTKFQFNGTHLHIEVLMTLQDALDKARKKLGVTNNNVQSNRNNNSKKSIKKEGNTPLNNTTQETPVSSNSNKNIVATDANKKRPFTTLENHVFAEISPSDTGDVLVDRESKEVSEKYKLKVKEGNLLTSKENIFTKLLSTLNYKRIANIIGLKELNTSQENQVKSFVRLHNFVTEVIQGDNGKSLLSNIKEANWKLVDGFIKDNKLTDENFITAITASIYETIKSNGLKTHLTREELGRMFFDDFNHRISKDFYNKFSEAGYNRAAMLQDLGDKILSYSGIGVTDDATIMDRGQLSISLGILAFTVMQQRSRSYGSILTEPVKITNIERLRLMATTVSGTELLEEMSKYADISKDNFHPLDLYSMKKFLKTERAEKMFEGANYYTKPNVYKKANGDIEGSVIVMDILKSSREIEGEDVIANLLKNKLEIKEPSFTKFEKLSETKINNSLREVPDELKERLKKSMNDAWQVNTDLYNPLVDLYAKNKEQLFKLLGLHSKEELDAIHPVKREEIENEENYYKEKLHNKFAWMYGAKDRPFYLNPVVWVNHRVGYESYLINPQATILDRALLHMSDWETKVNTTEEVIDSNGITTKHGHYLLGLAEFMEGASEAFDLTNLGYNPSATTVDKTVEQDFLPRFQDYIKSIDNEIDIAEKLFNKETMSDKDITTLSNLIKQWDMGELGLTALHELVKYRKALNNKEEFTTHIGRSSDGVTSGSHLSRTFFGSIEENFLLMGGYITKKFSDKFKSLQDSKRAGKDDFYESTGKDQLLFDNNFRSIPAYKAIGDIFDKWSIKFGVRKSAKTALNPFNYGSGLKAISNSVAGSVTDALINKYYNLYKLSGKDLQKAIKDFNVDITKLYKAYLKLKDKDNLAALVLEHNRNNLNKDRFIQINGYDDLKLVEDAMRKGLETHYSSIKKAKNKLGYRLKPYLKLENMLINEETISNDIPYELTTMIEELASITRGAVSSASLATSSADFIDKRNSTVKVHNIAFKSYDILEKEALNMFGKTSIVDLTKKQKDAFQKSLKEYLPIVRSPFNVEGEVNTQDLFLFKNKFNFITDKDKYVGIKYRGSDRKLHDVYSGFKYSTETDIGVGGLALQVQAGDSYISSSIYSKFSALNTHDSNTTKLDDYIPMVQAQNKAHWDLVSKYSLPIEALMAMLRPVEGLIKKYKHDPELLEKHLYKIGLIVDKKIRVKSESGKYETHTVKENILHEYIDTAKEAELNKKKELLKTVYVHQYAGGDKAGAYKVTGKDLAKLKENSSNNIRKLNDVWKVYHNINNIIKGKKLPAWYADVAGIKNKLSIVALTESTETVLNTVIDYVNKNNQEKSRQNVSWFKKGESYGLTYKISDKPIQGKAVHFSPVTNTITIADVEKTDAIVVETLKAIVHHELKEFKRGAVKNPEIQKRIKGLKALSANLGRYIKEANLTKKELATLNDTVLKHPGDENYLIATVIANTEVAEILDKVSAPMESNNDSIFDYILKFINRFLGNNDFTTLKQLILRNTNNIFETIKQDKLDNKKYPEMVDIINKEVSEVTLNYFNTGAANRLLSNLDQNNTITAHNALRELKVYLNNFVNKDTALIEQGLLPMVSLLEKTLSRGTKIKFVTSLEDYPQNITKNGIKLTDEEKEARIEKGIAFTHGDTVYLVHPDYANYTNLRASTIVHELFHVLTKNNLKKNSPIEKLYNEIKDEMAKSINPETRYAATNLDEFLANTVSNYVVQRDIAALTAKTRKTTKLNDDIQTIMDKWIKTLPDNGGDALTRFVATFSRVISNSIPQQAETEETFVRDNIENLRKLSDQEQRRILRLANNYNKQKKYTNFTDLLTAFENGEYPIRHLPTEVFEIIHGVFNINKVKQEQLKELLDAPVHNNSNITFTPNEVLTHLSQGNISPRLEKAMLKIVNPLMSYVDHRLISGKSLGEVWVNATKGGKAIYASDALAAGFNLTDAETYVLETAESALSSILDNVVDTSAYRKLLKSYNEAKAQLKPEDFIDDYYNATEAEKDIAHKKYDYLFTQGISSNEKSDYLTRFISLGLASEELNNLLSVGFGKAKDDKDLFETSIDLFKDLNDWVFDNSVRVDSSDNIATAIQNLSAQLADIHLKNQELAGENKTFFDNVADTLDNIQDIGAKALGNTVTKLTKSSMFEKTKLAQVTESVIKNKLVGSGKAFNAAFDYMNPNKPMGELRQIANELLGFDSSAEHEKAKDLLAAAKMIERAKQDAFAAVKSFVRNGIFGDKLPSKEQSKAISKAVLRADLQSLIGDYGKDTTIELLLDKKARKAEIQKLERIISKEKAGNEFLIRSKMLADYMIHRKVRNEMLAKNATAIAARVGIAPVKEGVSKELINNIDKITTLYAINLVKDSEIEHLKNLNNKEALSAISVIHSVSAKESAKGFTANPYSYQKGYIPNKTNPYRDIIAVNREDIDVYRKEGYKEIGTLNKSSYDKTKGDRVLMYISNNGRQRYVSGVFSIADTHKSGTTVYDTYTENFNGINNKIARDFQKLVNTVNYADYEVTVGSKKNEALIPSYDTAGNIISHSYEMTAATMDNFLERVNSYDELMGQLASQARSASLLPNHNHAAVDYAIDTYKNRTFDEADKFVTISPNSPNKKLREMWYKLPKETQLYIEEKTGAEALHVKNDVMTMIFGYQKYSPLEHIHKPEEMKKNWEKFLSAILTSWGGKPVKTTAASILAAWQEMIKLLKDFVVVRGISVIVGNLLSNTMFLMLNRFDPISATKDINTALKYSLEYQKNVKELDNIELKIKVEGLKKDLTSRRTIIKDAIARNPLKGFIEAGMMPTIVNDVDLLEQDFIFQSDAQKLVSDKVSKVVPKPLRTLIDTVLVSRNSKLHGFMTNATQQSDFVFRYAMYKQELKKGKSEKEAMRKAKDTFIDYDVPTSRSMQFMNDMGLWMYTKFFMRIQRVIMQNIREKPLGVAAEHILSTYVLGIPSIMTLFLGYRLLDGWNPFTFPVKDIMAMHEYALPVQLLGKIF